MNSCAGDVGSWGCKAGFVILRSDVWKDPKRT
jgi:hypothetical protein